MKYSLLDVKRPALKADSICIADIPRNTARFLYTSRRYKVAKFPMQNTTYSYNFCWSLRTMDTVGVSFRVSLHATLVARLLDGYGFVFDARR